MKKWIPMIFILFLMGLVMFSQQSFHKMYSEYSIEQHKMCLDQPNPGPNYIANCSQVSSAADSAYSSSLSVTQTSIFIMFIGLLILASWIVSLEMRLEKLESKKDV